MKLLKKAVKTIYRKLYYLGNTVYCPCCGGQFRVFQDYHYNKETQNESRLINNCKNTICPRCRSKPRHRIVCRYFDTSGLLPDSGKELFKILMFGAEQSIKEWFKKRHFFYTTADLFDPSADMKVDIHKTNFLDESWSLIICNHVLQHVRDYTMALSELKRILKKDGVLVLSVATDNNLETTCQNDNITEEKKRMEKYGQADYLRIFGRDFKYLLENIGFMVEVIDGNVLPVNIRAVTGPASHDDNKIYLCRKM